MGTAQNRKVYARHGYSKNMFGVSFANLRKLKKELGTDQRLAGELWETGNDDARMLAAMIADPAAISAKDLDDWVAGVNQYVLADVFATNLASKSPLARRKADKWRKARRDYTAQAGWDLVAAIAMQEENSEDAAFEEYLRIIEDEISRAANRTRHAMNNALIAIGSRNAALRKKAEAAARRIGRVEVDHGETGCKTPEAIPYIKRVWERKRK